VASGHALDEIEALEGVHLKICEVKLLALQREGKINPKP
jgi:hypothetical protein